jgi:hypothetical protein
MNFQLYADVVVVCDVPEENLQAGDLGTVIERHRVPGMETGYSLEIFNMRGKTLSVVTLPGHMLRSLTHYDRPTVRSEVKASGDY